MKRVRDIVRIFARVQREVPSGLVMVGDGPDRGAAEQEARDLGVHEHVYFLGKLDAVAPLLASADLFLLPSESESFGLSRARGARVRRAGGGLERGRAARGRARRRDRLRCAPAGDVDGMAAAALAILRDPARWAHDERRGRGGRARALRAG